MTTELDELHALVSAMPREMVREVLSFARHLDKKAVSEDDGEDWDGGFADTDTLLDRWEEVA